MEVPETYKTIRDAIMMILSFYWLLKSEMREKTAQRYDHIFIEDLNMKAMAKIWGRKINDLAFNEFVNILSQKVDVDKIDRFYPSSKTCYCCGKVKDSLELKERTFVCEYCGTSIDRDLNASINIHRVGASTLRGGIVRPALVG